MQKFIRMKAVAAPLPLANVDTDMIIPAQYMKALTRTGLGKHLFQELRFAEDGSERSDFILNKPACREAQVIIADRNFGCGSSREHAVWALTGFGIRCVIAPGFGDIFAGNARKNGLLLIRLPDIICAWLRDEIGAGSERSDGGCIGGGGTVKRNCDDIALGNGGSRVAFAHGNDASALDGQRPVPRGVIFWRERCGFRSTSGQSPHTLIARFDEVQRAVVRRRPGAPAVFMNARAGVPRCRK